MHYHIITLFPGAFDSYLGESIIKRAIEDQKISVSFYNPRDYTDDKWKRIDQRPYGGGPGMVIQAEPVLLATTEALKDKDRAKCRVIFFSPGGKQFDTEYAKKTAEAYEHIVMICGRYEGIDARVQEILQAEEISIGPFVTTGGELPAMLLMDSISRQIPGVLGKIDSLEENRISSHAVYTRPEVLEWEGAKYAVPEVLLSGHHKNIDGWKGSK